MMLVKSIKKFLSQKSKNMKFKIFNKTTKKEEDNIYADNPRMLIDIYRMNDEQIEIISATDENAENDLGLGSINEKKETAPLVIVPVVPVGNVPTIKEAVPAVIPLEAERYFTDNGIEYKINAGGSYKKTWVDVDTKLFRIVGIDNNKESKLTNKKIQTLDWVKIG